MVVHVGGHPCVSVASAAGLLEVSQGQVRELVRSRRLLKRGLGRPILIDLESVHQYQRVRLPWRRYSVVGGLPAAIRLGVIGGD